MDYTVLLSFSLLIGFLIHFTFGASGPIAQGSKNTQNKLTQKETAVTENGGSARIFLPNVIARWPCPSRGVNPNYDVVKKEADDWIASFRAFSPRAQDAFNRCDLDLFACLAFPAANKEHVRSVCDFMHLVFLFDEHSEWFTPSEVRKQKDVMMDALRNPHKPRPKDEWVGGEVARQFWERTVRIATTISQKRFIEYMDEYSESVAQEAIDRKDRRILDMKSYIDARRRTAVVKPSFSMVELGFNIPDEVMSHPAIQDMIIAAVDFIGFSNDIFSYNIEQRRGDHLYNVVTCAMHEYRTDVNGAMLWVADFLAGAEKRFHSAFAALPKWEEPLNSQVKEFCDGMAQWVRANDDWSFEGQRYFGNKGPEVKERRWMSLLPKKVAVEAGPMHVDGSLL